MRAEERGRKVLWLVFSVIWLIVGIGLTMAFAVTVPIRLLHCLRAYSLPVRDRGIARCNLEKGISVLYTPAVPMQRCLRQYQVYQFNSSEKKYFLGEWAYPISDANYSLIAFDRRGRCVDVIRVRERVEGKRFTAVTDLPRRTDYLSVQLHRAGAERFHAPVRVLPFFAWLTLFLFSIALAADALIWFTLSFTAGLFPPLAFAGWNETGGLLLLVAAGIVLIPLAVAAAVFAVRLLRRRLRPGIVRPVWKPLRRAGGAVAYALEKAKCTLINALHAVAWSAPVLLLRPRAGHAPRARKLDRGRRGADGNA